MFSELRKQYCALKCLKYIFFNSVSVDISFPSSSDRSQIMLWLHLWDANFWNCFLFLSPFSTEIAQLLSLQVASSIERISSFLWDIEFNKSRSGCSNICGGLFTKRSLMCCSMESKSSLSCFFLRVFHLMIDLFKCLSLSQRRRIEELLV